MVSKYKELIDKIVRDLKIGVDLKGFKGWKSILTYKWLTEIILRIVEKVELVGREVGADSNAKEDIFVGVAWELVKDRIGKVVKIPIIGFLVRKRVESLLRKVVRIVIALLNKVLGEDWVRATPSRMYGDRFNYKTV